MQIPSSDQNLNLGQELGSWRANQLQCAKTFGQLEHCHHGGVTSLLVHQSFLFSGSVDASLRVWDISRGFENMRHVATLPGHEYTVWGIVAVGKHIFSASSDCSIREWQWTGASNFRCKAVINNAHKSRIYSIAQSGHFVFTGSEDCTIKVWRVTPDSLENVHTFTGHQGTIWSLLPLHNDMLLSASNDRSLVLWSYYSKTLVRKVDLEARPLCLAISRSLLFVGTKECKILVMDLDFNIQTTLTGHSWEIWQLQADNHYLFSGSFDHTIKIWKVNTFECIRTLSGHKGFLHSLLLSYGSSSKEKDSICLLSGSGDRTIKVWRTQSDENIEDKVEEQVPSNTPDHPKEGSPVPDPIGS
eukprot:TRINITY_DN935_c0_g1_i2.p1 TRINITY_DN935_c0_g1~~TRINITY_DN935_c0_g1_i2.p1  ORF type:complete len:358 (-),score=45.29 TRINITY_DN935_c0_g1_i2:34-1107(-)